MKMQDKKKRLAGLLLQIIISYAVTISVSMLSGFSVTQIDILLPLLFFAVFLVIFKGCKAYRRENVPYAAVMAGVISLSVVAGSKMDVYEGIFLDWSVLDIGHAVCIGILVFFAFMQIFVWLFEKKFFGVWEQARALRDEKKTLCFGAFFFILAWMPYYLTFFPGNMGPDTFESVRMCLGEIPWTNHHPVLFTFLIWIVLKLTAFLDNLTISLGIFTFLHMVLVAFTLSYSLLWLSRRNGNKMWKAFIALFFAFHPIVAMYSMYLTKDVLFGCAVVMLTFALYELVESKGELLHCIGFCFRLCLFMLFTILLRNNGLYMIVALAAALLCAYRNRWKQLLLIFGTVFILTGCYKGPLFHVIGVEKQSFAESVSIPLQQVGYVIANDGKISQQDRIFLEKLMPFSKVKEVYEPGYTDPYKFDESFDDDFLNENKGLFLKVWAHLCKDNFSDYVKAYLMQTAGYWHYGETNTVCTQGVAANSLNVNEIDVIEGVCKISLAPLFEKLVLAARKAPIFCLFSSMAAEMYAVLFCALCYAKRKEHIRILALVPLIVLWLTIMVASPAFCLFRYLYPVFLLWPALLAEIFHEGKRL